MTKAAGPSSPREISIPPGFRAGILVGVAAVAIVALVAAGLAASSIGNTASNASAGTLPANRTAQPSRTDDGPLVAYGSSGSDESSGVGSTGNSAGLTTRGPTQRPTAEAKPTPTPTPVPTPSASLKAPVGGSWTNVRDLTWIYNSNGGPPQTQFIVQVAIDSGFAYSALYTGQLAGAATSYSMPASVALTDGTTYYWRVQVSNGTSWSPWSAVEAFNWTG